MPTTHDVASARRSEPTPLTAAQGRAGVVTAGLTLTYLAAATIPWTAVDVGSISIGEILLALAAVTLVAADLSRPLPTPPPWVWALAVAVLVVGTIHQFAPPSAAYMARREGLSGSTVILDTNLVVTLHLVIRVLFTAFVFALARAHDRRALTRSSAAFLGGVSICAVIAFTDSRGWTSISSSLLGVGVSDGRGSGLTEHPNVVAMTCVIALPLMLWLLLGGRRARGLALAGLGCLLLGLYASRSRSGAGAAAIAAVVSFVWMPQYRRYLPTTGLLATLVLGVLFVTNPDLGSELLSGLRITGGDTSGSDRSRTIVNDQAMRDFLHSPIHGIGFEIADIAHFLYLQALAVGGVILLTGLIVYQAGALIRSARLTRVEQLAVPLFVAVLGEVIFNTLQNALTPTIAYLAPALVAALPSDGLRQADFAPVRAG
jgi:hypothetical protein